MKNQSRRFDTFHLSSTKVREAAFRRAGPPSEVSERAVHAVLHEGVPDESRPLGLGLAKMAKLLTE